ncbi:hypothetical protein JCM12296A_38850 [Desulfosarcina cetonica]|uniref:LPS assembly lipoprotein LptE n=1 Tax=Desulfosarcina cetonica TaxID=90730 RepID=UPI0006D1F1E6|nr:LPS assembly lipoprotein LptE [Desulfosarcina cetonica]
MKSRWKPILLAATLVLVTACGYHFAGSGSFPGGATRIFIPMLENRTSEIGVESRFTNNLIYEFIRNRKSALAKSRASADAILSGTIVSISVENISRSTISNAIERRVTAVLSLRLVSTTDGRTLWASGNLSERQAYTVASGSKAATDQNKSEAIAEVSRKLAESAYSLLTDNF